jgi:hypothetical protein
MADKEPSGNSRARNYESAIALLKESGKLLRLIRRNYQIGAVTTKDVKDLIARIKKEIK